MHFGELLLFPELARFAAAALAAPTPLRLERFAAACGWGGGVQETNAGNTVDAQTHLSVEPASCARSTIKRAQDDFTAHTHTAWRPRTVRLGCKENTKPCIDRTSGPPTKPKPLVV